MICKHQLHSPDFVSTCQRMNQLTFVIYQSKIRRPNHHGNPSLTYLDQIYLSTDKTVRFLAEVIAMDKQLWNPSIAAHKLPT